MEGCDALPQTEAEILAMFPGSSPALVNYTGKITGAPQRGRWGGGALAFNTVPQYSAMNSPSSYANLFIPVTSGATMYVGYWFNPASNPGSSSYPIAFMNGPNILMRLKTTMSSVSNFNNPTLISIVNGAGTTLQTVTDTFANLSQILLDSEWYWMEVGMYAHASAGWIKVRLNNIEILSQTGINTLFSTTVSSCTTTNGSASLGVSSISNMSYFSVGQTITGTNIQSGTVVTAMDYVNLVVTLSKTATGAGTNTMTVTSTAIDTIGFNPSTNANATSFVDDIFVWDASGSAPFNGFQSCPLYIETLNPMADVTSNFSTQSPSEAAGNHYLNVSDMNYEDADATYIQDGTTGHRDGFQLSYPITQNDIYAVQLYTIAKNTDASARSIKLFCDSGTHETLSSAIAIAPLVTVSRTGNEGNYGSIVSALSATSDLSTGMVVTISGTSWANTGTAQIIFPISSATQVTVNNDVTPAITGSTFSFVSGSFYSKQSLLMLTDPSSAAWTVATFGGISVGLEVQ